ncbi:hypothetical protein RDI58_006740 [Solanum bulbocastanum]|uniref:Uncharacterized protein n=1 Tax=Solanum bulbocastanum TaxID=147425 RepID=A0AAN8YI74_SOLBU
MEPEIENQKFASAAMEVENENQKSASAVMEVFEVENEPPKAQFDNPTENIEVEGSKQEGDGETSAIQLHDQLQVVNRRGDEVVPLRIKFPEDEIEHEEDTAEWIQECIIKLSSEFWVDFKGCEEKAKEFFRKIDNNKQQNSDTLMGVNEDSIEAHLSLEVKHRFWLALKAPTTTQP